MPPCFTSGRSCQGWPRPACLAYIKPPWFFAEIFNRIALATGAVNSEPMTVIKRGSKLPQTIPMTPVDVDGVKYLVSVRGEIEWVKSVRANPHLKLNKSSTTDFVATEMAVEARKPILEAYKATASRATARLFRQLPDDADHPVFALTPVWRSVARGFVPVACGCVRTRRGGQQSRGQAPFGLIVGAVFAHQPHRPG